MSDLISRKAVLDELENYSCLDKKDITTIIKAMPPVENKAEWVLDYRDCGVEFYRCSKCNLGRAVIDGDYYKSLNEFKKCPICGCQMNKENNNVDE